MHVLNQTTHTPQNVTSELNGTDFLSSSIRVHQKGRGFINIINNQWGGTKIYCFHFNNAVNYTYDVYELKKKKDNL